MTRKPNTPQEDKADVLAFYLRLSDLPEPEREYRFAQPEQDYRSDFAWPSDMLLVEVDGGTMMVRKDKRGRWVPVGRHNTDKDRDKLNLAAILGYRVLRFSTQRLEADPWRCLEEIGRALGRKT